MKPPYQRLNIDLATVRDPAVEVLDLGKEYNAVAIVVMPAGANASLV